MQINPGEGTHLHVKKSPEIKLQPEPETKVFINPEAIIGLYKSQMGVDIVSLIGSPLLSVEKKNHNFTFQFAKVNLELNEVKHRIHDFKLALAMHRAELVYPTFTIEKNKYRIHHIDLETNLVELVNLTNQEKKYISIDSARHHQHAEIINRLKIAEVSYYEEQLTTREVLSELNFILLSIKKIYSFSNELNFHTSQVLIRVIQQILNESNLHEIELNMQSWDPDLLKRNQDLICNCQYFISQFKDSEITEVTLILNKLSHLHQKINYKLETLQIVDSAISLLINYQNCTQPIPHLWFDYSNIEKLIKQRFITLKQAQATIPQMIKILEQTAFLIEEKIQLACQESTIQFQKILEELQHLKILSKPKTSFQALDKLELILESLKEKNILHIHRSLQISIYQQDTINQLNINIPELHPGETYLTIGAREYSETIKRYKFFVQKRIQWLQQIDIENTEELEKLSKQNPQEFYNQIHRILRQRQLSKFMHQDAQRKKQGLINKIIKRIKSEREN